MSQNLQLEMLLQDITNDINMIFAQYKVNTRHFSQNMYFFVILSKYQPLESLK